MKTTREVRKTMNIRTIIKRVAKEKRISQEKLAEHSGIGSQSTLASRLSRENMSIKNALQMLDALGYELVVQPKTAGKRKVGAYVVTMEDEDSADSGRS